MMIGPARSPMLCCSRTERISVLFLTELRMRIMMTSLGIDHSQRSGHYLLDEVPTDSCESLPQDHLLSKEKSAHCAILWRLCQLGRLSRPAHWCVGRWESRDDVNGFVLLITTKL